MPPLMKHKLFYSNHQLTATLRRSLAAGHGDAVVHLAEGGVLPVGVVADPAALEVALDGVPGVGDALVLVALLVVVQTLVHLLGHDGVDLAAEHVHRDGGADLRWESYKTSKFIFVQASRFHLKSYD